MSAIVVPVASPAAVHAVDGVLLRERSERLLLQPEAGARSRALVSREHDERRAVPNEKYGSPPAIFSTAAIRGRIRAMQLAIE